METVAKAVGAMVVFAALIVIAAPLGALLGAFAGWTVSLFFGDTILKVIGLHGVTMWQLGATGGFLGSFLRTTVTAKDK